ncbi:DUF2514 domain-containing protein [Pseudomonas monsensis]
MAVPWKAVGAIVLVLIGAGSAWQFQDWRYGKQLAEIGKAQALAITEAGNSARVEEQRRQSAVNKEAGDAREQNEAATVDAGNADVAGDRLHVAASKFAVAACSDPGTAQRGASATRAAMVLSDLLQRADKRAGELAVAYDRARIAGLTCERSYDGVRSVAR